MKYQNSTNLVVGLEFDGSQLASWTFMATSKTSHIATDLRYSISQLEKSALDYNATISGLTMQAISDAVNDTGPQAMTRGIPEPGAGNRSPSWPAQPFGSS